MLGHRLLSRIEQKKARLDELRPLAVAALACLQEQILIEWVYNSNAIDGSNIALNETRLILETGLTIGGKSMREHFEVINHRDAIRYVEDLVRSRRLVTPFEVRQIHKLVFSRIDDGNAGQYRQSQVRTAGAGTTSPDSWLVPNLVADWAEWLADEEKTGHPVTLAALAHHRLAAIHPFNDGNGRTARLVLNLILMRAGFPPAIILYAKRRQYYRFLELADAGKPAALVNFVGRAVESSLNLYLEASIPVDSPPEAAI